MLSKLGCTCLKQLNYGCVLADGRDYESDSATPQDLIPEHFEATTRMLPHRSLHAEGYWVSIAYVRATASTA